MKTARSAPAGLVALSSALVLTVWGPHAGSAQAATDGTWRRLDPDIAWGQPGAAYNAATDRLVVLPDRLDAIWSLDLAAPNAWHSVPVAGAVAAGRDGQPLVHDAVHDRWIWLRLSDENPNTPTEMRTLDATQPAPAWELVAQGFLPGQRSFALAAYDATENRVFVFGGVEGRAFPPAPDYVNPKAVLTDTWVFDFDDALGWRVLETSGVAPRLTPGGGLFHDADGQRLILFGQEAAEGPWGTGLWTLSLEDEPAWSHVANVNTENLTTVGAAYVFEPARGRIDMHGGKYWATHGSYGADGLRTIDIATGATQFIGLSGRPGARGSHAAVYDAKRDRLLLQGGRPLNGTKGSLRETWGFDLAPDAPSWTRLGPWEGGPRWRVNEASAYDPAGERVLVWGGGSDFPCTYYTCPTNIYSDMWSFDLSRAGAGDWDFHPGPSYGPEGRVGPSLVHDAAGGRLVGFGGVTGSAGVAPPVITRDELETFPLSNPGFFTVVPPSGSGPPARYQHASVVDRKRNRMLVLGGSAAFGFGGGNSILHDGWSWDLAGGGWTELPIETTFPGPGPGLQAAIDPGADRVVAVSWEMPAAAPVVWSLSLAEPTAWTRLDVVPGDAPANPGTVAWDPVRGRLVLFEYVPMGYSTPATLRGWALEESPQLHWRRLDTENALAVPEMWSSRVVYDAVVDRFVVAHPGEETSVWALEIGTPRWPIALSWAAKGKGRGNAPPEGIVLHSASPAISPIFPRAIDLARVDPATWTWTGVEIAVDGQGRPRIDVEDVDGDGRADWIVHVRGGAKLRDAGANTITFETIDRDGVRLVGALAPEGSFTTRLHDGAPAGDATSGETFAVRPLVARGSSPSLSFASSSLEPVTAALYDVRGRRVATRTWTPAGEAPETVSFDDARSLPPGIYLARVRQGDREATVRLVRL